MAKGDFQKWMADAQRRTAEWARGRNGVDALASACSNVAILLVVVDLWARTVVVSFVALAFLGYSWFRMSSRNVSARRAENERFTKAFGPVAAWLSNPVAAATESRTYKHLTCPSCGQRVRIPRGKGKVRVTCPKCHTRFEGKA